MATIVTRSGKGSPLTNTEVDANFTNLNTELGTKANTSSLATVATSGAYSDLTGKPANVSSFSNDSGYITSSALSPYLTSSTAASTYQPLDGDLTAIAALAGTTGLIRKTAANTYSLDTATYLTGITSGNVTTALGFTPANKAGDTFTGTVNVSNANVTVNAGYGLAFVGDQNRIITPDDNVYGALIKWGATGGCRFFESTTERMRIDGTGSVTANVDFRAPIFYDSADASYYVDPNSATRLNKLTAGNRSMVGNAVISMSGLDANTWYPVTIPIPVARQVTLRIENALNSNVPSWSTHPAGFSVYIEWITNGLGWGTIGLSRRITDWREQFTSVQIVGGIDQMTFSSQEVIWLRGGANYYFSADCDVTPTIRTSSYDANGQVVAPRSTVFNDPWETAQGKMSYGTFQANERVTAGTDMRAPIFYDSPNTAFYLDPAGSTSLNAAGSLVASGNITLNNGANRRVRIGSATNYSYDLQTTGDDFQIIEAGVTPRLTIKYPNGNFGVGTTNPAVKFVVSNGGAAGLEIDPNGGIGGGSYIQSYNRSTGSYTPNTNYASTHTWYTGATRRMDLDASGRLLVGLSGASASISSGSIEYAAGAQLSSGYYGRIWRAGEAIGSATYAGLYGMASTYNAYYSGGWKSLGGGTASAITIDEGIYSFSNSNSVGAGDAALTWATRLTINTSGNVIASVDMRAPLFYDSNNTGYYVDPEGGTRLNSQLEVLGSRPFTYSASGGSITIKGDAGGWATGTYFLGSAGTTRGGFGALGGGDGLSYLWAGNAYNDAALYLYAANYAESPNSFRAPIFYDNNNTAYYIDPNSTSRLNNLSLDTVAVTSGITGLTSAPITTQYANAGTTNTWYPMTYQRAVHNAGYVTHLNTGLYKSATDWGSGATGWYAAIGGSDVSPTQAWYLTYDGLIQNSLGYVSTGGSFRAPTFYDSQNTNYYLDPVSGFYLGGDGSTTYQSTGSGLFITNPEGTGSTVRLGAAWSRAGSYSNGSYTLGSESSIHFWISNSQKGYIDSASNLLMNGSVQAPIFYDSGNTAYYVDPNSSGLALRTSGYWVADTTTWAGEIDGKIQRHANSWYFSASNNWVFRAISGAEPFIVNQGGTAIASADMRAPIFYDNNNTAFYVDPNSTSRLERLVLSARYDNYFVGSMAVVNAVSNFQTLTDTFGQMSVMQVSDTGGFTNAPTGLYPYGAVMSWRTENHSYQMYASHTGDIAYKTQWNNDNYSGWLTPMVYGRNGGSSSGKTVYGSIYYDSDNTGYYSDPSSTSRTGMINADNLRTQNNVYIDQQYGSSLVGAYNSVRYQGVYAMGDAYKLAIDGTTAGNLYGIAWAHPNAGGVAANLNTHGALFLENGAFLAAISGSIRCRDDMRAPIFYDSNDTGYYLDAASTSRINQINYTALYSAADGNYGIVGANGYFDTLNSGIAGDSLELCYFKGSFTSTSGSMRAPIFYDRDNTGYYLDPTAGSYLSGATFTDLITGRNSPSTDVNSANDTGSISIRGSTTTVAAMSFHRAGAYAMNVGLGTDNVFRMGGWSMSSNAFQMDGSGNLTMLGNVTAYSDARIKKDVVTVTNALDLVGKMRGVTYTRKDTGEAGVGVIAQEMLEVLPQVVQQGVGDDDTLSVAYGNIVGVLIEAIKELRTEVEMLRK